MLYTREAINAFKNRNYDIAIGALYSFNGLLPDSEEEGRYRVIVDTNEYNKITKQDLTAICKACKTEVNYNKLITYDVYCSTTIQVISGVQLEKIWVCPDCKKENVLAETEIRQKRLKDPVFLIVVPKPPTKKDGIIDGTQFHSKFSVWFWTFLSELEAQAARFRRDYKSKHPEDYEFTGIMESDENRDM